MAVVLLDPSRPDMVPAGAVALLTTAVAVTEEVHPNLLWQLHDYVLVGGDEQRLETLVTSDPTHPAVRARLAAGERVIQGEVERGAPLLRAVDLMDRLRRTGPWEQRQTHHSLRRYLLEECYELLDAIESGTRAELRSELGDLLLQVLFHARIAEDSAVDAFDIDDVAQSFIDKVSNRTPGVLDGEHADLERQIDEWEAAKASERASGGVLDGIVTTQPALALVQKVFERLAGVDFPVAAISPSLYAVSVPLKRHASTSVEDDLRRRAIALMDQVRAAETAALADGELLRDENAWRRYLGMDYDASLFGDDLTDTGEIPVVVVEEPVDDDVEYEDVSLDADPIAIGKKPKKIKGIAVADVPPAVVVEKWSAAGE
ncbi:nucleoside triphosphate pyrophosphohydrolase [Gordonia spumicola]|uniref:Nucleoside triphosphate pyrophosphohydrolase n=1 Tax=Gordonia spumicola TaxID=589161 RepID=A0A7I9V669_9ACTN|nr:MazG family protein [Gordonia spumicola]GEE00868.1 nucleoside triphosphate pyrophosphohydrolase [Gordonia spumicola]